jgi:hypothetical protein
VHGDARGLVDDQHQPIAVEQAAHYLVGRHLFASWPGA